MARTLPAAAQERLRKGEMEAAIPLCRALVADDPGSAASFANLALCLKQTGRLEAAVGAYRRALLVAPDHAQIHNNFGAALADGNSYRKAIILAPGAPGPYHNLGSLLRDQGRIGEAPSSFHRALRLQPGHPDLHGGLATLEQYRERLDHAIPGYRRAIALQPERYDFYTNLGNGLRQAGRMGEAETAYRRAIRLAPGQPDAPFNLSLLLLAAGRLREGWPGYEYRWETAQLAKERRDFAAPVWRGEAAAGKTLLLHGEQGLGDTLQFCRYAALAKEKGLRIVLEVQPPLRRLLADLAGCDLVLARGEPLPDFDFHCPLLSLPMMLGTDRMADIPAAIPYIRADRDAAARWAERVPRGKSVGLAWAGAPRADSPAQAAFDRRRSLPPEAVAKILAAPGVRFVSLQKGRIAGPGMIDFMAEMTDFADTAALIAPLDLVISVDTAIAHLAGAMGKPVWLLNRLDTDWRWLTEGETTPWYPTMRIFRQRWAGDWDGVIDEVIGALARDQSSA
jgi:Tfp pilus assembly protein PilF